MTATPRRGSHSTNKTKAAVPPADGTHLTDPERANAELATFWRKTRFWDVNRAPAHGVKNSKLPDGRPGRTVK